MMKRGGVDYRCSFCGKTQESVRRLIAGPGGVYICDECVALCQEIISEEMLPRPRPPAPGDPAAPHWVSTSGRRRGEATVEMPAPNAGHADGLAGDGAGGDEGGAALQVTLAPLVAEVAAARATIERLARENGALRERLEGVGRGDGEPR